MRPSLNQLTFSKSRSCSTVWVGLVQSGEDLNRTKTSLPQWRRKTASRRPPHLNLTVALLRRQPAGPTCRLTRLRNCMSHFLKINYLPTYPFICRPTYLSIYLPIRLPTHLPIHPSIYLPAHLSIYRSYWFCFSRELWLIHMVVTCMFSFLTKCLTSLQWLYHLQLLWRILWTNCLTPEILLESF